MVTDLLHWEVVNLFLIASGKLASGKLARGLATFFSKPLSPQPRERYKNKKELLSLKKDSYLLLLCHNR